MQETRKTVFTLQNPPTTHAKDSEAQSNTGGGKTTGVPWVWLHALIRDPNLCTTVDLRKSSGRHLKVQTLRREKPGPAGTSCRLNSPRHPVLPSERRGDQEKGHWCFPTGNFISTSVLCAPRAYTRLGKPVSHQLCWGALFPKEPVSRKEACGQGRLEGCLHLGSLLAFLSCSDFLTPCSDQNPASRRHGLRFTGRTSPAGRRHARSDTRLAAPGLGLPSAPRGHQGCT